MLFSIVVPVYNVEKYIRECLDSLIAQSVDDYEIILVDDGSTDSSGKICDDYAKRDNRIKVIHKKNEGLLMTRRTGINACRGDYILHCDSDDYLSMDALARIKDAVGKNHPDMVMYGCNIVDDHHAVIEELYNIFDDSEMFDCQNKEKLLKKLASTVYVNSLCIKATKRECVDIDADYMQYRDIKMKEDLLQVMPLLSRCSTFVYIARPLYFYRYNNSGITKNLKLSYIYDHMLVSDRVLKFLKSENVSKDTLLIFYNRYIKDTFKCLLSYLKINLSKKEYTKMYNDVRADKTYIEALKHYRDWSLENKILRVVVNPCLYGPAKLCAKTILNKKLS